MSCQLTELTTESYKFWLDLLQKEASRSHILQWSAVLIGNAAVHALRMSHAWNMEDRCRKWRLHAHKADSDSVTCMLPDNEQLYNYTSFASQFFCCRSNCTIMMQKESKALPIQWPPLRIQLVLQAMTARINDSRHRLLKDACARGIVCFKCGIVCACTPCHSLNPAGS